MGVEPNWIEGNFLFSQMQITLVFHVLEFCYGYKLSKLIYIYILILGVLSGQLFLSIPGSIAKPIEKNIQKSDWDQNIKFISNKTGLESAICWPLRGELVHPGMDGATGFGGQSVRQSVAWCLSPGEKKNQCVL